MTQLLISVKNVDESLIARYAGVDVIDLKDPAVGALGALDTQIVSQIVLEIDRSALVSATVGEGHESVAALVGDIKQYASLGIDVVKMSVSELCYQEQFFTEMLKLTAQGIKLVAVFFADKTLDFNLLEVLQKSGFYGAMLDTQIKRYSLLEVQSTDVLNAFVVLCKKHHLISGLAGSVKKEHMITLLDLTPTFIGLRGGVCDKHNRASELSGSMVNELKRLLLNYNSSKVVGGDT
jgi:(5-formylfuran-3-yl)methyl phosphate synthase